MIGISLYNFILTPPALPAVFFTLNCSSLSGARDAQSRAQHKLCLCWARAPEREAEPRRTARRGEPRRGKREQGSARSFRVLGEQRSRADFASAGQPTAGGGRAARHSRASRRRAAARRRKRGGDAAKRRFPTGIAGRESRRASIQILRPISIYAILTMNWAGL